jgi:hypothetical protein
MASAFSSDDKISYYKEELNGALNTIVKNLLYFLNNTKIESNNISEFLINKSKTSDLGFMFVKFINKYFTNSDTEFLSVKLSADIETNIRLLKELINDLDTYFRMATLKSSDPTSTIKKLGKMRNLCEEKLKILKPRYNAITILENNANNAFVIKKIDKYMSDTNNSLNDITEKVFELMDVADTEYGDAFDIKRINEDISKTNNSLNEIIEKEVEKMRTSALGDSKKGGFYNNYNKFNNIYKSIKYTF